MMRIIFFFFLPSPLLVLYSFYLVCGRPGRACFKHTQTKLPTACLSNIFNFLMLMSTPFGMVQWLLPLLIKSPVHHVNPLTEANAIDLFLVSSLSYLYMQRLRIVSIHHPLVVNNNSTLCHRHGGPILVRMFIQCWAIASSLSFFFIQGKKEKVFLIFCFSSKRGTKRRAPSYCTL